jgi:hypothetical protein
MISHSSFIFSFFHFSFDIPPSLPVALPALHYFFRCLFLSNQFDYFPLQASFACYDILLWQRPFAFQRHFLSISFQVTATFHSSTLIYWQYIQARLIHFHSIFFSSPLIAFISLSRHFDSLTPHFDCQTPLPWSADTRPFSSFSRAWVSLNRA